MTRPVVLGLDPGFASFGWCLYSLGPTAAEDQPLMLGVIRTEKSEKKRGVRSTDDNVERCRVLARELAAVVGLVGAPMVICAEAMSFVRSSAVMAKVGMAWGCTVQAAETFGIPLLVATPQELKKSVCGRGDASKEDVQSALRQRYNLSAFCDSTGKPFGKSLVEHPADALGAIVACLDTNPIRMARGVARAAEEAHA